MPATLQTPIQAASLVFTELPGFARFLLENRLDEYAQQQLKISREIKMPLLSFFSRFSDAEMLDIGKKTSTEYLTYLSNNQAEVLIENTIDNWKKNLLPHISKSQIVTDDITLISYLRKKTFVHFLPDYTNDIDHILKIIGEIDRFLLAYESASFNYYIQLQQEKINEHLHFIEKVAQTSPSIIYVYDENLKEELYTNRRIEDYLGFSANEFPETGIALLRHLIHDDDRERVKEYNRNSGGLKDAEIRSIEFRVKDSRNQYRWIRSYETVFKRNPDGSVWQRIGVAIDIDNEKKASEKIIKHEKDLLEAQELAGMGSFEWDFTAHEVKATPQLMKILELEELGHMDEFMERIHPEDRGMVEMAVRKAIENNQVYEADYRLICKNSIKVISSRGLMLVENGKRIMRGTIIDVTERHNMIQKLLKSEELYKQAQALSHIGNYSWDLVTNEIVWSDELFRIYGLTPGEVDLSLELILSFVHPQDKDIIEKNRRAIEEGKAKGFDHNYRIIHHGGEVRILHAKGEVQTDPSTGIAKRVIGSVADITDKQTLLEELEMSQYNYRQAALMAKMGNWTWDPNTGDLKWTDELFALYEIDPQPVDYYFFLQHLHPEDLERVQDIIKESLTTGELNYQYRIITPKGNIKTLHSIARIETDPKGKPVLYRGIAQDISEKEKLLKELELSTEQFKQAQSIAHMGNWSWDIERNMVSWTDEIYRIFDIDKGKIELTYEKFLELLPGEEKNRVIGIVNRCVTHHEAYDFYHTILTERGELKYLHAKGEPVLDNENNVTHIVGTVQDVTLQQQVEQELRSKQNFIQKIADATPSFIASFNVNTGKYVFANQGIKKLLDIDPEQVLREGFDFVISLLHPEDRDRILDENEKAIKRANDTSKGETGEFIVEFEYRIKHANGSYRWFHTYGTVFDRNERGEVEHVLNISLDITDTIESRKKIQEQEYFISHIADASPMVLYLFDAIEGKVIYINKEAESVIGYTPQEIIDMGTSLIPQLYHPEDRITIGQRLQSYKNSSDPNALFQFEVRMKHKDGSWRWLLIREVVFAYGKNGMIERILGAALDITSRKEMESTLFRRTRELQQSNASLGEFAYVASHDLKEPLRKISTFGDMLVTTQSEHLSKEGKLYLRKMIESSRRMQMLIDDLLSLSLISGERNFVSFSLQDVLNDVLQSLEHKITECGARIRAGELPTAKIIPSQFRQLFQNLLTNSLKYVKKGIVPEIHISHTFRRPSQVKNLSVGYAQEYLELVFTDNGIGFEQVFAEKIFTIFQRLHGKTEYEGTGIGLAICKKIVEHHGGVIYAEGKPEQGAKFIMVLPVM